MEYTKDMVLNVNYKGDKHKKANVKTTKTRKIVTSKVIYTILGIIGLLTIVDFYLVSSFFNLLVM